MTTVDAIEQMNHFNVQGEYVPIRLKDPQKRVVKAIDNTEKVSVISMPRQTGMSLIIASYAYGYASSNPGKSVTIAVRTMKSAYDMSCKVWDCIDENTELYSARNYFKLSNGSVIRITPIYNNVDALRGMNIDLLMVDSVNTLRQSVLKEIDDVVIPVFKSHQSARIIMIGQIGREMMAKHILKNHLVYRIHWWECFDNKFKQSIVNDIGVGAWERDFVGRD